MANKNWIQWAIKNPGALRQKLNIAVGKNIPKQKLNAAAKKWGTIGKQANLAKTLASFKK